MLTVLFLLIVLFLILAAIFHSWAKFFTILAIAILAIGLVVICVLYENSWYTYKQRQQEMMRFMNYFNSTYYFSQGIRWTSGPYGAWISGEYGLGNEYQAYHDPEEPFKNFERSFNPGNMARSTQLMTNNS